MQREEAIKILRKETSQEAITELKCDSGLSMQEVIDKIQEAMEMGADALERKTVTKIIEEVKEEFCNDFCKRKEECEAKLDSGEWYYCPLDRL